MHQGMAELPEHCREILDRFFARDESYRQIGDALDAARGNDREPDLPLPEEAARGDGGKKSARRGVLEADATDSTP